ncbi:CDP-diacylglycerol--serine O-phosphatidyltransferase [Endozoicomonas sp. 8E]|uniref:CDP-diacylglycerol--serine O-phosphatidyltransferase n=1 Tax=Endozoicomonas sp. 8E TaxID=3035692 RepID=UPI0029390338|nr:CDP-diacylglycerol--serine O-phosphatidyltransferase [Endozoicomonas sp. 8E]WOG28700.1 CDP-diacylglycerol--serine O-phosphatidyltransferase [Endozoicomonas sp. 8E]
MSDKPERPENGKDAVDGLFPVDEHFEEVVEGGETVRHKGIYILPNLFTTGNLFCGFYAIISAQAGFFTQACISVFVAMILDGLDGRVARMTNTQSKFGAEYDSLADMVTFGVTPAMVAYSWALNDLGKVGWMVAFIYAACAALRLARFNTQLEVTDSRYFTGLASPAAAALVIGMVWALSDFGIDGNMMGIALLGALITGLAGVLMVSNFKYNSFKKLDLKGRVPFIFMIVMVLAFAVVFTDPPRVLMLIFLSYACSGPIMFLIGKTRKQTASE